MTKTYLVKLKGVSFVNDDGTSRQELIKRLRPGEHVKLLPDPTNPHDRWAVKVLTDRDQQIGWLPSDARDADALLRGEPVIATIHSIRGGTNWFYRLLGKKYIGVVLDLKKGDLDWTRRSRLERLARPFDEQIEGALRIEQTGDIDAVIVALQQVISDVRSFTRADPHASAHRRLAVPIDRLTLALERQNKFAEALGFINEWKATFDPVQPTKTICDTLRKRAARLEKRFK